MTKLIIPSTSLKAEKHGAREARWRWFNPSVHYSVLIKRENPANWMLYFTREILQDVKLESRTENTDLVRICCPEFHVPPPPQHDLDLLGPGNSGSSTERKLNLCSLGPRQKEKLKPKWYLITQILLMWIAACYSLFFKRSPTRTSWAVWFPGAFSRQGLL